MKRLFLRARTIKYIYKNVGNLKTYNLQYLKQVPIDLPWEFINLGMIVGKLTQSGAFYSCTVVLIVTVGWSHYITGMGSYMTILVAKSK